MHKAGPVCNTPNEKKSEDRMKKKKMIGIGALCALIFALSPLGTRPVRAQELPPGGDPPGRIYFWTARLPWTNAQPSAPGPKPQTTPAPQPAISPGITGNSKVTGTEAQQLLAWINEDRAREGLPALTLDASLSREAQAHAEDMAAGRYCSHVSPSRGTFAERAKASGIRTLGLSENVARYGSLYKAHVALMASASHRANLMKASATHIGLGIARDSQGVVYVCEWVARLG